VTSKDSLDKRIDHLYTLPLSEFIAARTALAKTLTGEDAKRVKGLAKPLAIPWAVNQLYWQARAAYNQLAKSGEKLRATQIAALNGRSADVQGATAAHRKAVSEAVAIATRLASAADAEPAADALGRMLEAISLSENPPETPGRFTRLLRPAGFEALAGVSITSAGPATGGATGAFARALQDAPPRAAHETPSSGTKGPRPLTKAEEARIRREAAAREKREREDAERRWRADVEKAEAEVARSQAIEEGARAEWERTKKRLAAAKQALENVTRARPS
jgi:hypothetical protein